MYNVCGDNRFDVIDKAKKHILDATNINTSEDEMKVLNNFLFRCWQMDWLDKYDDTKHILDIKELNQKLHDCYRLESKSEKDIEWNRAIYKALRIINGEE